MRIASPLSLIACIAIAGSALGADHTALVGVHIVDLDAGRIVENRTVLIEGDRIVGVFEAGAPLPEGADAIDMTGRFALPGLIDSHVHYAAPDVYDPLMIAHGVALAREMGGETETVITLRDERESGSVKGPRLRVTGAIVDGVPPTWPFSEAVDTPEAGRAAVRRLHEAGVDYIKVYQGLKPDVHEAICDEAQRLGLMPFGHVPSSITVEQALENGQRTIEHLTGVDATLHRHNHPDGSKTPDFITAGRAWTESAAMTDDELHAIVAPFAVPTVAHCPTLAVYDGVRTFGAGNDPNDRYHPTMMKSFWSAGGYADWGKAIDRQMPTILRATGALHDAGGVLIAGTDLANPGVVAGVSLHRELELFVEAGLTPVDALRGATTVPAAFFGFDDLGAVAPGMDATILLLGANPLDDINATRDIEAVVHRGDVYDRAALDALLEQAASAASAAPEAAPALAAEAIPEFDLPGELIASGVYSYKFGQFDAGRETFRITRTDDGYSIATFAESTGGPQPPSVTTIHANAQHHFVSGTYRVVGRDAPPVTYAREGAVVTAIMGEESQTVEAPFDAIIAGSSAATDFAALGSLSLAVGESVTPHYISFGNPNWRLSTVANTITRLENGEATLPDGRTVGVSAYRQTVTIPGMGEMHVMTLVDGDGVVLASTLRLPMGELKITLDELVKP
ncbi:MAG: amidohydrolase family protein [Phycisphaerales bacterium]